MQTMHPAFCEEIFKCYRGLGWHVKVEDVWGSHDRGVLTTLRVQGAWDKNSVYEVRREYEPYNGFQNMVVS